MKIVEYVQTTSIVVSIGIVIYILIDSGIKKRKLEKNVINKVNNNKYILLITVLIVLFIIYGILRNFKSKTGL